MVNGVTASGAGINKVYGNLKRAAQEAGGRSGSDTASGLSGDTAQFSQQVEAADQAMEAIEAAQTQLARIPLEVTENIQSMNDLKGNSVDIEA